MVLLRQLLGDVLRRLRIRQGRPLREVSASARVSLGYLSEVERGRKEASSELLASICDALDLPLSDLLHNVAADVRAVDVRTVDDVAVPAASGPVDTDRRVRAQADPALQGGRMVPAVGGNDLADPPL